MSECFDCEGVEIKVGDIVTNKEILGVTFKVLEIKTQRCIVVQADGGDHRWIENRRCYTLLGSNCAIVEKEPEPCSAWSSQEGGNHYKQGIQPAHFSMSRGHSTLQAKAIKYIDRYKKKDGLKDLKKARHVLDMLIEWEENGGDISY